MVTSEQFDCYGSNSISFGPSLARLLRARAFVRFDTRDQQVVQGVHDLHVVF